MRSILAGLVLVLLPGLASADCVCTCVRGKSIALCRPQAMIEPICQQVCVEKIEQSLGPAGGGGVGGGITGGNVGGGVGGGVGIAAGSSLGDVDSVSRSAVGVDRSSPNGR